MQNRKEAFQLHRGQDTNMISDPRVSLQNLSIVRTSMDSLRLFLSESIDTNTLVSEDQMNMVSNELVSAIHQIILNGAVLVSLSQNKPESEHMDMDMVSSNKSELNCSGADKGKPVVNLKVEVLEEVVKDESEDCEIMELDAVELLAEHVHFCEICGKGFRRDANLRMHMRAHGNQFKTSEALAKKKPGSEKLEDTRRGATARFSCPFEGCNRNKSHKKFRALKSIVCARNHFKRSHCPKMYSCNRCHKKNFSVLSDLKSHMKHCGQSKWKCSCGTTFSRKDKLFGHIGLFEGHSPALPVMEGEEDEDGMLKEGEFGVNPLNCLDDGLPEGFFDDLEEYESTGKYNFPGSLNSLTYGGGPT